MKHKINKEQSSFVRHTKIEKAREYRMNAHVITNKTFENKQIIRRSSDKIESTEFLMEKFFVMAKASLTNGVHDSQAQF